MTTHYLAATAEWQRQRKGHHQQQQRQRRRLHVHSVGAVPFLGARSTVLPMNSILFYFNELSAELSALRFVWFGFFFFTLYFNLEIPMYTFVECKGAAMQCK